MKRYFELINKKDGEPKSVFYGNEQGHDILGMLSAVMERFNDFDIRNYRLFEYDKKSIWQAKQDSLKLVFSADFTMSYYTNKESE